MPKYLITRRAVNAIRIGVVQGVRSLLEHVQKDVKFVNLPLNVLYVFRILK